MEGMLESVPDQYKTHEMCDKPVDNYAHAFVPDCYETKKISNKDVNTYPSTTQFVPEYYKTQEMCDKVVNTCFWIYFYKTQDMCDRVVSEDLFMLMHYPHRYKTPINK